MYEVGWDSCFNVFEYVKDEHNFSIIAFMKIKLCNELRQHLDTIICMFVQELFYSWEFPLPHGHDKLEGSKNTDWC